MGGPPGGGYPSQVYNRKKLGSLGLDQFTCPYSGPMGSMAGEGVVATMEEEEEDTTTEVAGGEEEEVEEEEAE